MGLTWRIDLGSDPVAVDLAHRTLLNPHWLTRQVRFRSGWLRVTQARLDFSFGTLRRDLLSCVDDFGYALPVYFAKQLFEMGASFPYTPDEPEPCECLDRREDELLVQFLKVTERATRAEEAALETETARQLRQIDHQAKRAFDEIRLQKRELRRGLKQPDVSSIRQLALTGKILSLEALRDSLIPALRQKMTQIRQEQAQREEALLDDRETDFEIDVKHTVRWRVIG